MREYLLVFLVAAAMTYLFTVIAREIAIRTNAVAKVRSRDVHAEPVPYLGGLAMLGGMFGAYIVAQHLPFLSTADSFVFDDAQTVLIAGALICAVGVIDDIFDIDALTKLGGQILAAGYLVYNNVQFYIWTSPSQVEISLDRNQGALLTVFVVVLTVNAVNFIDGLDGLAAGVIGVGALAFFVYCYTITAVNQVSLASTGALLSAALAGACIGFLPHNFHPARLFMGDSGSMLIGLVLAAASVTLTGQFSSTALGQGVGGPSSFIPLPWIPILLPIALLIVPLADLVLAVIRRTRAGRSPFAPDRQHLHHRMLEIGHSHRRAVLIIWCWAALIAFGTVWMGLYQGEWRWGVLGGMLLFTLAATFLLPVVHGPHLHRSHEPGSAAPDGG